MARAPRQPLHVTTWLTPRHPHASRPFPVGEMLADPPFGGGVVLPITATPSASSVTASSLFPRPLLSTIRFSQSFRTAAFGSVRFCSFFPYRHFLQRSPLYTIPAHGRFEQRSPSGTRLPVAALAFSQSFGTRLSLHTVAFAGFRFFHSLSHTALASFAAFAHSISHTVAFGNNRISQSSGTRLLVAAFVAHGRFRWRSPPPQPFAHGHLWRQSPLRSLLAHGRL